MTSGPGGQCSLDEARHVGQHLFGVGLVEHLVPCLRVHDLCEPAAAEAGDPYFTFDPHWNARGHQAAAEAVAADLRARSWLPACAKAAGASAAR